MSQRIWKDVLYPGTLHVPTGDPQQPIRVVRFTPDDLRNVVQVNESKLRDGWNVPACWEHQDVWPVHLSQWDQSAQQARNVFGPVVGYRLNNGVVEACLEVEDEDVPSLKKIRYVSPRVSWDWVDSTGKKWPGMTITHVAATPRPVQHKQRAFNLSHGSGQHVCLSLGWYHHIDLSEGVMADEIEGLGNESGGGDKLGEAISLLEQLGVHLGDGTDQGNFFDRLVAAVKTKLDHDGELNEPDGDEMEMEEESNEMPTDVGPSPQPPPVTLSLQKQLQMAQELAKRNLIARAEALKSKIGPKIVGDLVAKINSVNLSFAQSGDLKPNAVLAHIEAYEQLPAAITTKTNQTARGNVRLSLEGRLPDERPMTDDQALAAFEKTLKS